MSLQLSIIVPAYNEEKRIRGNLINYADFFSRIYKKDFEILVILNGCIDNTLGVVKDVAKSYPQIKYRDFKAKIGKGGAVLEGFKIAEGDLIGFVDADGSTPPQAFNDLIVNIKKAEGIIASRWIKGAKMTQKQPLSRRFASRSFNIIIRILFGIRLRDTQCGAKLFKKRAIKRVLPHIGITKWAFDIDLLYQLKRKHYKVKEIPTLWADSEDTKLNMKKVIPEMFLSITRLRLIYSPFRFIVSIYDRLTKLLGIKHM